jgi:hypothetical protein
VHESFQAGESLLPRKPMIPSVSSITTADQSRASRLYSLDEDTILIFPAIYRLFPSR